MSDHVTILMPVRNAEATLQATLASIASQTLTDHELLVIDDHSSDDSRGLLERYASHDSRCRIIDNPAHGLVAALNAGLAVASADLIARMDADDLMVPERLATQANYLRQHPGTDLLGSCVDIFPAPAAGNKVYMDWQNRCLSAQDIRDEIYVESPFTHPSVMFRRQAIQAVGGYRDGDFPEDYELWLRLHHAGIRMQKLPDTLLHWRDSPSGLTRTDPRYRRSAFDALRARYLALDERFSRHSRHFAIWGAGRRTRMRCAHLLALGFKPRAWIDIDPRKIGNRLAGVPVVAPDWLLGKPVFVLAYVANHGARGDIALWLEENGFGRGNNYLMVG